MAPSARFAMAIGRSVIRLPLRCSAIVTCMQELRLQHGHGTASGVREGWDEDVRRDVEDGGRPRDSAGMGIRGGWVGVSLLDWSANDGKWRGGDCGCVVME